MSAKQSAINRANKLLKLAAPSSGTTEAERISAALEATKIIDENDLVVVEKIDTKKQRPHPQRPDNPIDWFTEAATRSANSRRAGDQDGFFRRTRSNSQRDFTSQIGDWDETITDKPQLCAACGYSIRAGEQAFRHPIIGWRHYDITCDQFT